MGSERLAVRFEHLAKKNKYSVVGGPFGSNLVSRDYVETGVPVIRGKNMGQGKFICGPYVYVSDEKAQSLKANIAQPGDLVFTQRGTLGQVAIVPDDGPERYVVSQSQMKATIDPEKADTLFLYYYFSNPIEVEYIKSNAIQTGVPHTNLTQLKNYQLSIPALPEQKAISSILGSLDNKIQLNRQTNQTLEQMAQALFKSWFVDFDPVIDNALAAGNEIPEPFKKRAEARKAHAEQVPGLSDGVPSSTQISNAHRELFPSEFEETEELGWVPKGWGVGAVGSVIENVGGGTPKTKEPSYWDGGQSPFCTPKDMSLLSSKVLFDTERKLTEAGVAKVSSGVLPVGTVLMSSRAPIGYLAISKTPVTVNQGIIAMKPTDKYCSEYLLLWTEANMDEVVSRANGSTFLEISKKNFRDIPFVEPTEQVCSSFSSNAGAYFKKIALLQKEVEQLTKLRDTLLPKLISGELRIPESADQTDALSVGLKADLQEMGEGL